MTRTRAQYRWEATRLLNEVLEALARGQAATDDDVPPPPPDDLTRPPSPLDDFAPRSSLDDFIDDPAERAAARAWIERRGTVLEEVMPDAVREAIAAGFCPPASPPVLTAEPDEPDDAQFWNDVGRASDPDAPDVRKAMDRLAKLVRLRPADARELARQRGTTMTDTKRWLVQTAVLFALGAADESARTDRQKSAKADEPHPLTLPDVFGADGLADMLAQLTRAAITAGEPVLTSDEAKAALREALGGPFRPAHLLDRMVLRRWLTTEIRRRVDVLLREEVRPEGGHTRATRRAGTVAYDTVDEAEEESRLTTLSIRPPAYVPPNARAPRDGPLRADSRFAVKYADQKRRMEDALVRHIDFGRWIDEVRLHFKNSPLVLKYLDRVRAEPALAGDPHAAATALGWDYTQVEQVRHRVKRIRTQLEAHRRFEALVGQRSS